MRLNTGEMENIPRMLYALAARVRYGALASAVVIAIMVGVGSAGSTLAAPVTFSPVHPSHRILSTTRQASDIPEPPSADVFMQAIITHDGERAWQQLCPALQAQVLPGDLTGLINGSGSASASQGGQLVLDVVGTHPWNGGGEVHVYVVTAHLPSGTNIHKLFVLRTPASGCVDGIWGA